MKIQKKGISFEEKKYTNFINLSPIFQNYFMEKLEIAYSDKNVGSDDTNCDLVFRNMKILLPGLYGIQIRFSFVDNNDELQSSYESVFDKSVLD